LGYNDPVLRKDGILRMSEKTTRTENGYEIINHSHNLESKKKKPHGSYDPFSDPEMQSKPLRKITESPTSLWARIAPPLTLVALLLGWVSLSIVSEAASNHIAAFSGEATCRQSSAKQTFQSVVKGKGYTITCDDKSVSAIENGTFLSLFVPKLVAGYHKF
jgi:hypothetical protein